MDQQMTREQMVAEFGEPGVQNPSVIDLIAVDAESNAIVLAMVEKRPWDAHPQQLKQIEEKINRYLGYVVDGFFVEQYPQYKGRAVQIRLDCADAPVGEAIAFLDAAKRAVWGQGLEFAVRVVPAAS